MNVSRPSLLLLLLAMQAGGAEPLVLVTHLADGSRVIGEPTTTALPVTLPGGALVEIQWDRIRRIHPSNVGETVTIQLLNQDEVTAQLTATHWTLKTLFGPCTIPVRAIRSAYCRRAGGRELDWEVLPITSSDPEARPTNPPELRTDSILLDGWTVRTARTFARPITFECAIQLTQDTPRDAMFSVRFVPADEPRDTEPKRFLSVFVGQRGGRQIIGASRHNGHAVTLYEGDGPFPRNQPIPLRVRWSDERLEIQFNGRTFTTDAVHAWYDAFHLDLVSGAPRQRWRVSETVVRFP
ncbi:MAG: hypothetical protein NZ483_04845 [Verrucomicrobiae bacterium]|nr:hypothetical protein [Verrucomicrobiae bacterium]